MSLFLFAYSFFVLQTSHTFAFEHVHASLDVQLKSLDTIQGSVLWSFQNQQQEPIKEIYLYLPINFQEFQNENVSKAENAKHFRNTFEPSVCSITHVEDVNTQSVLNIEYVAAKPQLQTYSLNHVYVKVHLQKQIEPLQFAQIRVFFKTHVANKTELDGYFNNVLMSQGHWMPLLAFQSNNVLEQNLSNVAFSYDLTIQNDKKYHIVAKNFECQQQQCFVSEKKVVRNISLVASSDRKMLCNVEQPNQCIFFQKHFSLFSSENSIAALVFQQMKEIEKYYESVFLHHESRPIFLIESKIKQERIVVADGVWFVPDFYFYKSNMWFNPKLYLKMREFALAQAFFEQRIGVDIAVSSDKDAFLSQGLAYYFAVQYMHQKYGEKNTNYLDANFLSLGMAENRWHASLPKNILHHMIEPQNELHQKFKLQESPFIEHVKLQHREVNHYRLTIQAFNAVQSMNAQYEKNAFPKTLQEIEQTYEHDVVTYHQFETILNKYREANTEYVLHEPSSQFHWFGLQPIAHRISFSFNMLPMHEDYIVGGSFNIARMALFRASLGGGLEKLGQMPQQKKWWLQTKAFAQAQWQYDRASYLQAKQSLTKLDIPQTPTLYVFESTLQNTVGLFEKSNIGLSGEFQALRTTLTLGAQYKRYQVLGPEQRLSVPSLQTQKTPISNAYEGNQWSAFVFLHRDNQQKWGHTLDLSLKTMQIMPYKRLLLAAQLTFKAQYPVSYLGEFGINAHTGIVSPSAPGTEKISTLTLIVFNSKNPFPIYDSVLEIQPYLKIPILRHLRLKSEILLNSFFINDVFLSVYAASAIGSNWHPPTQTGLHHLNRLRFISDQPLVESGAFLDMVLYTPLEQSLNLRLQYALQAYPVTAQSLPHYFMVSLQQSF